MKDKAAAEKILQNTIKNNLKHQDYDRVTQYAQRLRRLITGQDLDEELKQFVSREDTTDFAQRKKLTQLITPAVCSRLMSSAYKIARVKPIVKRIDFEEKAVKQQEAGTVSGEQQTQNNTTDADTKIDKLETVAAKYYGDKSVDQFLEERFIPMSYIDPNAFVLTLFDKFDNRYETARPYPTIISSEDAVNYEIANDTLQWLIIRKEIKYNVTTTSQTTAETTTQYEQKDGCVYWMYLDNDVIEYSQVDEKLHNGKMGEVINAVIGTEKVKLIKIDENKVFRIEMYEPKAGMVQAKRIGFIPDEWTNGRTCVSPLHPALPYLLASIKSVSELHLSISLHVFLQKFIYEPPCTGESLTIGCDHGRTPDGSICKICKGTGVLAHASAQDTIRLALPRDPSQAFELSKLVHYADTQIDIVKFLNDFINELETKCITAIYNNDLYTKTSISDTATGRMIDMQSYYDALYPLSKQYSSFWVFTYRLIANLTDLKNAIIEHQFGKDFKFDTVESLMERLKLANDSDAPTYVRQEITRDITKILFVDRPDDLKRLEVKENFNPFNGKTSQEIQFIISNGDCTRNNKILWSESNTIFTQLEEQYSKKSGTWFYDMDYNKQKELIDAIVEDLKNEIDEDKPKPAVPFGAGGLPADVQPQGDGTTGAANNS